MPSVFTHHRLLSWEGVLAPALSNHGLTELFLNSLLLRFDYDNLQPGTGAFGRMDLYILAFDMVSIGMLVLSLLWPLF